MSTGEAASGAAHPSADELVDLAEDRTPASDRARIGAHLAGCPECREILADLRSYPELEPLGPEFQVGDDEMSARLAELRTALGSSGPSGVAAKPVAQRLARRKGSSSRLLLAWAAVAIFALGAGLYLWLRTLELRRDLETAGSPRPNVVIVALLPDDDPLRNTEAAALPPGSGLALAVSDDVPFPAGTYRAEIVVSDGTIALALDGLEPDSSGSLSFYLPPAALEPGDYRVVLRRAGAGVWPRRFTLRIAS